MKSTSERDAWRGDCDIILSWTLRKRVRPGRHRVVPGVGIIPEDGFEPQDSVEEDIWRCTHGIAQHLASSLADLVLMFDLCCDKWVCDNF